MALRILRRIPLDAAARLSKLQGVRFSCQPSPIRVQQMLGAKEIQLICMLPF
jgi:hypothetical protein